MKRILISLTLFLAIATPAFAQLGGGGGSCNSTGSGAISSGTLTLNGATSGVVTVQPQAAAGTYNFNLPTTAGTTGQFLTSAGGASAPMTWTTPPVQIISGTTASIAAATTDFIAAGENAGQTLISTEANGQWLAGAVCTLSNLNVTLTTAVNANHPVITLDIGGVGQTLTCTVDNVAPDTTTHCEDTTHTVTTAVSDLLSIKLANPASANATGVAQFSFKAACI